MKSKINIHNSAKSKIKPHNCYTLKQIICSINPIRISFRNSFNSNLLGYLLEFFSYRIIC